MAQRYVTGAAAIVATIGCLKIAAPILAPVLVALVVAMLCAPAVDHLKARNLSTWSALALLLAVTALFGLIAGAILHASADQLRERLPLYQERLSEQSNAWKATLIASGVSVETIEAFEPLGQGLLSESAADLLANSVVALSQILAAAFLATVLLPRALALPSLRQGEAAPGGFAIPELRRFTREARRGMLYLTASLLLSGLGVTLWFSILSIDFAPLWGLLTFILGYVPSVGMLVAAVPAILQAYLQYGIGLAVASGLGMLAVTTLLMWMTRQAMAEFLRLPTLVAIVSAVFWVWVLGPLGALLTWPLNSLSLMLLRSNENTQWVPRLLGSREQQSRRAGPAENPRPRLRASRKHRGRGRAS